MREQSSLHFSFSLPFLPPPPGSRGAAHELLIARRQQHSTIFGHYCVDILMSALSWTEMNRGIGCWCGTEAQHPPSTDRWLGFVAKCNNIIIG